MSQILIVAATAAELCGHDGLVCGVGPVEAATATAAALATDRVGAVLHVGLAGARGVEPGALVLGTAAVYRDLAAGIPVVDRALPAPELLAAARTALPDAKALEIATSARIVDGVLGRDEGIEVEAMEGFGVLRACERAGVPALELRAVSNVLGEPDRSRWDVHGALAALRAGLVPVLAALELAVSG